MMSRYKKIIAAVVVALVAVIGWEIYYSFTFHLVRTAPSLNNIATVTPIIDLDFNRVIVSGHIVSQPSVINSWKINNKVIALQLKPGLVQNKTYTIILHNVKDINHQTIPTLTLRFTPQVISFNNLPAYEQRQILNIQAKSAANQPPTFGGISLLTNSGISINQVLDYEQAVQQFTKQEGIKTHSVNITSSADPGPNNGSGIFSYTFTMQINQTTYKAVIQTQTLTSASLQLFNQSGALLFSSGVVNQG